MRSVLASALVLIGCAFMFAAALGVARFPDVYTRMQATTKAATVGVVGVMSAVAVALHEPPITVRALLVAFFFLLTAPVAAHAIARSAYSRDESASRKAEVGVARSVPQRERRVAVHHSSGARAPTRARPDDRHEHAGPGGDQ